MLETGTELTRVLKLRDAMGVDSPGYPFNQIGKFAQSSTTPKAESPAGDAVTRKQPSAYGKTLKVVKFFHSKGVRHFILSQEYISDAC